MMQQFEISNFRGLVTSEASPSVRTAKALKNFLRHKKRGELWEALGYAKKYGSLPENDGSLRKISALSWKDIHNFWVPEHGGRNVTVLVGTYTKGGWTITPSSLNTFGIWIRPYWDGANWVDAWHQLTEVWLFELRAKSGTNRLFIDDVTADFDFQSIGGYADVFATDYFKGWTVVFDGDFSESNDDQNYLLVTGSDFDGSSPPRYYLDWLGDNTNLTDRAVGDRMHVYRNFVNAELPASVTSHIFSLLNEIRMTSGNQSTDVTLMAGYRNRTRPWSVPPAPDAVVADVGPPELWRRLWATRELNTVVSWAPLASGQYYVMQSLVFDDGSESELRQIDLIKSVVCTGTQILYLSLEVSPSTLPRRARTLRIYLSDNNRDFYAVKDLGLDEGEHEWRKAFGTRASDPATTPTGAGRAVAVHPDGDAVAVAHTTSPFVTAYPWTGSFGVKVADPATLPTGNAEHLAFSPDGRYLVVAHGTSPYVTAYPWDGTFGAKLDDPTDVPAGDGKQVAFSPDGRYVAVGHANSPFISVYEWNNGFGAQLSDPADLPAGVVVSIAWSPNGAYVAVGVDATPYFHVYEWNNGFGARIAAPVSLPTETITGLAWSPDGESLVLGHNNNPSFGVSVYSFDGSALALVGTRTGTGAPVYCAFSPLGGYVLRGYATTLQLVEWAKSVTHSLTDQSPSSGPVGNVAGVAIIEDAVFTAEDASPYVHAWPITIADSWSNARRHQCYVTTPITIDAQDWTNAGAEASTNIGRAKTDPGVVRAMHLNVVGRRTYAAQALVSGSLLPNKLLPCALHGDGTVQWDVFPLALAIDLEYNDGDEIVGTSPIGITDDRILVVKRRGVVVVTPRSDGGFDRTVVTTGDGCSSAKGIARFDDVTYWPGYNGVYRFVQRSGWMVSNPAWIEDWKALSDAVKEAAVGTIDAKERQYLLTAGGVTYRLDLDDGETMVEVPADVPSAYAVQTRTGKVDVLSGSQIYTLADAELHDGDPFTLEWESNRQTTLTPDTRESRDLRVVGFGVRYESDVALTLTLYLGDSAVAACTPWTLAAGNVSRSVYVPVDVFARCKYFRWKVAGTKSLTGQKVRVRGVTPLVEVVPAGGDQRSL
jgi:hypothetical protein